MDKKAVLVVIGFLLIVCALLSAVGIEDTRQDVSKIFATIIFSIIGGALFILGMRGDNEEE